MSNLSDFTARSAIPDAIFRVERTSAPDTETFSIEHVYGTNAAKTTSGSEQRMTFSVAGTYLGYIRFGSVAGGDVNVRVNGVIAETIDVLSTAGSFPKPVSVTVAGTDYVTVTNDTGGPLTPSPGAIEWWKVG